MFENLRKSINDLLDKATPPEERRLAAARMRDTLVQAKVGLQDLRDGLARTQQRVEQARRELETTRRRKTLAGGIGDAETVRVAEQFERTQAERLEVLEQKAAAQERELALAEREVSSMSAELRAVVSGTGAPAGGRTLEAEAEAALDEELGGGATQAREEIDSLGRQRMRAERDAEADRRLEELKRRMGK